jgi:NAD(P)-dependent dehydrogenase (short-subunit alcohol dehydrogenase family)
MTRVMARELGPHGWQINCYCPGKILGTEMTEKTDKQVLKLRGWEKDYADRYALSNVPVGRFMTKSEAAHNCLVMLQFTKYVNGAIIEASGGQ